MEFLSFLRALARHRLLLVTGIFVAALTGAAASSAIGERNSDHRAPAGFAQADVLIDTRRSQAADLRGGAEELGLQSTLLASHLADDPQTRAIALQSGVPWGELEVVVQGVTEPIAQTRLARSIVEASSAGRPYRVTVHPRSTAPIIRLRAVAPSRVEAILLVRATRSSLARLAAKSAPGPRRRLRPEPLGDVRFVDAARTGVPAGAAGVLAGLLALAAWWYSVALGRRASLRRRRLTRA